MMDLNNLLAIASHYCNVDILRIYAVTHSYNTGTLLLLLFHSAIWNGFKGYKTKMSELSSLCPNKNFYANLNFYVFCWSKLTNPYIIYELGTLTPGVNEFVDIKNSLTPNLIHTILWSNGEHLFTLVVNMRTLSILYLKKIVPFEKIVG